MKTYTRLMLGLTALALTLSGCASWPRLMEEKAALNHYPELWPGVGSSSEPDQEERDFIIEMAILSEATYADYPSESELLLPKGWTWQLAHWQEGKAVHSRKGLAFNVYEKQQDGGTTYVAIAFRGTEGLISLDWLTNLSLLHRLGIKDQYWYARQEVREVLEQHYPDKLCSDDHVFVATGHSLGGGLASSTALSFPCITAISFNASPVKRISVMQTTYKGHHLYIYENGDPLGALDKYRGFGDLRYVSVDTTRGVKAWSHSMLNLTLGLMTCEAKLRDDFTQIYEEYIERNRLQNKLVHCEKLNSLCLGDAWKEAQVFTSVSHQETGAGPGQAAP